MAIVNSFFKDERNISEHSTKVDVAYSIILRDDGIRLVNIASFGSTDRMHADKLKVSQTLQFDQDAAKSLTKVFAEAFGWPVQ